MGMKPLTPGGWVTVTGACASVPAGGGEAGGVVTVGSAGCAGAGEVPE